MVDMLREKFRVFFSMFDFNVFGSHILEDMFAFAYCILYLENTINTIVFVRFFRQ